MGFYIKYLAFFYDFYVTLGGNIAHLYQTYTIVICNSVNYNVQMWLYGSIQRLANYL